MAKVKVTKVKVGATGATEEPTTSTATRTSTRRTVSKRLSLREELVLGTLLAEVLGSFIVTAVALTTSNSPIIMMFAMIFTVVILNRLSGGHINPIVTIALAVTKQMSVLKAAGYIVAQILGAMLALVVITQFMNGVPADAATGQPAVNPATGQPYKVFEVGELNGTWRPFFAEALGALILAFGAMAAFRNRKQGAEAALMIGGALFLGMSIATIGSAAVVNPAAAFGLNGYQLDNMWTLWAYAAGPIVGAIAGAWLYRLMQWDLNESQED